MLVLHATWSTSAGELHLWAEDPARPQRAPLKRARGELAPPHPFAAEPESVDDALGGLLSDEDLEVEDVALLLPSTSRGPRRSPRLVPDELVAVDAVDGLAPWTVPVLLVPGASALPLLAHLREPDAHTAAPIAFSESVRCFAELDRLARKLAERGAFIPAVHEEGGEPTARWEPFGLTSAEQRAVQALSLALPASARSELPWGIDAAPEGGWSQQVVPGSAQVVRSALQVFVDQHVRGRWCSEMGLHPLGRARAPRSAAAGAVPDAATRAFLRALGEGYSVLDEVPSPALTALRDQLAAWVAVARPEAPYRTCFRLVDPEVDGDEGLEEGVVLVADDGRGDEWSIEFALQSKDDPSLVASAAEVWSGGDAVQLLSSSGADPQEHLLASLAVAARLYAPLEASLREAAPTCFATDAVGAWSFLRDGVPLLEQAGFATLVPPWWGDRGGRLGLKARARANEDDEGAAVGGGEMNVAGLLSFHWTAAVGDEDLTEDELRTLAAAKVPLVRVRGRWVEVRPEEVAAAIAALQDQAAAGEAIGTLALLRMAAGIDKGPGGLPVVAVEAQGKLGELLTGNARPRPRRTPSNFVGSLRAYQRRGVAWLAFLERCGLGACLADDMGLGKTIQVLAQLAAERTGRKARTLAGRPGATLLVCPLSVVGNWGKEAARFVPSLVVYVHHGPTRLSGEALAEQLTSADLVITTYALATRDQEELRAHQWHRVVLDEAQAIKNRSTKQSRAVRSLPAERRAALTGTPVENRLSELHSVMDFLNPGLLGSAAAFRRGFVLPIERDSDVEAGERLRRVTRPFVLRRLKTDPNVAPDLPDKVELKVECRLTREQVTLYQAVVDDLEVVLAEADDMQRRGAILAAMTKLKQVCDHPALLLKDRSELAGRSGKLARTEEILEEALSAGDGVLLFTQYAQMGKLLRAHLQERFGEEVLLLHGGATRKAREGMVERFQSAAGPRIFVLSIKAGGTGLNLTAANHVLHFDRWWNPAVEDQATDRAYRIGQHRNVLVHKLVCAGTLEERIDAMIERKKALADLVVGVGEDWLTELSTEELRSVFALSAAALQED